jgi:hypothetical protein
MGGMDKAKNVVDVIALADNCHSYGNSDSILLKGEDKATSVKEVIALANHTHSYSVGDQILDQGVNFIESADDLTTLAGWYHSNKNKDAILGKGAIILDEKGVTYNVAETAETASAEVAETKSAGDSAALKKAYDEMDAAYKNYMAALEIDSTTATSLGEEFNARRTAYEKLANSGNQR